MGTNMPITMSSCLVDMGLAAWFGGDEHGDEQVRQVARTSALSVPYEYRTILLHISVAKYPSRVVNEALNNVLPRQ